jgi:NAD(P)-dependent dehydrogenase (short-subunit alcohol dehydrogenase family)
MTITVITGANKGLGYETARRLIERGHHVILGSRDAERGRAAASALGGGARVVQLDVTSDSSVDAAIADIANHEGRIDVLINNAGIPGSRGSAAELTAADATHVFETNVVSIVRMTHAALPLLAASQNPVIVNVSSGMGSFGRKVDDSIAGAAGLVMPLYSASKAAVTMLTTQYAEALPGIRINAADPGYTDTDFNGHRGTQTIEEGTDAIIDLATIGADGPTGQFHDRAGVVPW